ncbi:hypothetical protein T05_10071 [Trichinella murrelli]|uniref:Uncharacterized protein n=1 Tax=Trichinella murrelli TaxID=144512 RepID=A0A0V0U5V1_9BILA|nr:hypothetical protein T05_10071 [Trichinella murrelli]
MGSCGCESWDLCCHKPTSRSPLPICSSRYQYCYGVEPHKRKQPCTEPADPKHAYTLGENFVEWEYFKYITKVEAVLKVKMEKNCWDKFPLTESNVEVNMFCRRRTNRANEE